jgi:hypothetical protein
MSFRASLLSLLAATCALPLGSIAADADPARQFVELLRYGEQYRLYHENCLRQAGTLSLESFHRRLQVILENPVLPDAQ